MATSPNLEGVPHVSYVYVYAEKISSSPDHQSSTLPSSTPNLLSIVVNFVRKYRCVTGDTFIDHNSSHEFKYPFDQLGSESNTVVSDMLSAVEIPFPFENLYWTNPSPYCHHNNRERLQLNYMNDMHRMISEVAGQIVRAGSTESGWTSGLSMRVTIENQITIPYRVIHSLRQLTVQELLSSEDKSREKRILRILEHHRRRRGRSSLA